MFSISILCEKGDIIDKNDDEYNKQQLEKVIFYAPPIKTGSTTWDMYINNEKEYDATMARRRQKNKKIETMTDDIATKLFKKYSKRMFDVMTYITDSQQRTFYNQANNSKKTKNDTYFGDDRLKKYFGEDLEWSSYNTIRQKVDTFFKLQKALQDALQKKQSTKQDKKTKKVARAFIKKFHESNETFFRKVDDLKTYIADFLKPNNITVNLFLQEFVKEDETMVQYMREQCDKFKDISSERQKLGVSDALVSHAFETIEEFLISLYKFKAMAKVLKKKKDDLMLLKVDPTYDAWQSSKRDIVNAFMGNYEAFYISKNLARYSVKEEALGFPESVKPGDNDAFKAHMCQLLLRTVFNGLTRLNVVKINKTYITFTIESKTLCIPYATTAENENENQKKEEYLAFPFRRYENVHIRLKWSLLTRDNFTFTGVYPIWHSQLNVKFESPLKDIVSFNAMAHFGTIQPQRDNDTVFLCTFLSGGRVFDPTLFQKPTSLLIAERYKTTTIDNDEYQIEGLLSKSKDIVTTDKQPHDFIYILIPPFLTNRVNEKQHLLKMIYNPKDERKHKGRHFFTMETQNSLYTTFSIGDIHEIMSNEENPVDEMESVPQYDKNMKVLSLPNTTPLPDPLEIFIEQLMPDVYESKMARDMKQTRSFWEVYIMALYSYYVNYMEIERDKTQMKRYGSVSGGGGKNFEGYVDDWLSTTHVINVASKGLVVVYSTFSLHQATLRLRFEAVLTSKSLAAL
jgi:hypothetical protein